MTCSEPIRSSDEPNIEEPHASGLGNDDARVGEARFGTRLNDLLAVRRAETLRRQGNHQAAVGLFRAIWEARQDPEAGWQWCFCLRHLGQAQEALELATNMREAFPTHDRIAEEVAWALYETGFKPAKEAEDLELAVAFAERMVEISPDRFLLKLTILGIMGLAREKGVHEVGVAWGRRLPPEHFPRQGRTVKGVRLMSDRERWYIGMVKGLLAIQQFDEALAIGERAIVDFPSSRDFPRWIALALEGRGDRIGARRRLNALTTRQPCPWYVRADLARMLIEDGETEAAWKQACLAAIGPGELRTKVNLFALLGRIAEQQKDVSVARDHVRLSAAIRTHEGWSIPASLGDQLARLELDGAGGESIDQLKKRCQKTWSSFGQTDGPTAQHHEHR